MNISPFTDNLEAYLKEDDVIDFGNENIVKLVDLLSQNTNTEIEYIKTMDEKAQIQRLHGAELPHRDPARALPLRLDLCSDEETQGGGAPARHPLARRPHAALYRRHAVASGCLGPHGCRGRGLRPGGLRRVGPATRREGSPLGAGAADAVDEYAYSPRVDALAR